VHRDEILSAWDMVGRRPWTLWRFDYRLERGDWRHEWDWPQGIESEQEFIRFLLLEGELEPCTRDGAVVIDDEVAAIEKRWRHEIGFTIASTEDVTPIKSS
jgi:hypothetical protein